MIYTRGHPTDYDDWAAAGNPGWSYREVLPYFRRSENNETWRNSIYHGVGGPMNVAEPVTLNPMVDVLFEATDSLQFRRSVDFCGENMEGFGVRQLTQRNGRRESTATAFLNPARRRSNLTIITNALVDRIALDGTNATGVALITKNGEQRHLTARREVLLAAGAIASPMILMRSGIGDGTKLQTAGVPVAHHLRGVGRNLQEHVTAPLQYRSDSTLTYGLSLRIAPRMAWSAIEYLLFHRGLLSTNGVQAGGFIRSEPGLSRPDLQFIFLPAFRDRDGKVGRGHGFGLTTVLLHPTSRGDVTIRNPEPTAAPVIDFNFFSAGDDLPVLRRGFRVARRILEMPAFAPYLGTEVNPGIQVQVDDEIDSHIRATCGTVSHPVGTCAMGHGADAVVDTELKVHGIERLRVIDASVIPTIIGGNTNAPVVMIAEKASDMIRRRAPPASETRLS
jgi:choline dehydrogenase-like flavoprotein